MTQLSSPRSTITASSGVQLGSLRGGAHAADPLVADPGLDRADQAGVSTHRRQGRVHEVGGRGLAVRAGDADQAQGEPLGAENARRHGPENGTRVLDHDGRQRHTRGRHPVDAVTVGEHRQRPRCGRLAREVCAVGPRTGQGGVEVAGEHGARVEGHPGDGHLRGRVAGIQEGGEVPEGCAAEPGRSGNGHVGRPYRSLRLCPLRRTVGSASASSGVTLRVTFGAFLPVGGIFSSCRA